MITGDPRTIILGVVVFWGNTEKLEIPTTFYILKCIGRAYWITCTSLLSCRNITSSAKQSKRLKTVSFVGEAERLRRSQFR